MQTQHCCVLLIVLVSLSQAVNCQNQDESKFAKFIKCDPVKASSEKSSGDCPSKSSCIELGEKSDPSKNSKKGQSAETAKKSLGIDGLCACAANYTVNESYSSSDKNSAYCIERNSTTTVTSPAPSTSAPPPPPAPPAKPSSTSAPATVTQLPTQSSAPTKAATQVPTQPTLNNASTPSVAPATTTTAAAANASKVATTVTPTNESATTKNKAESNDSSAQPQAHHFLGGIMLPLILVLAFVGVAYGAKKYDLIERAQTFVRNRRAVGQPHQTRYDGLENDFDDDPLLI